jgi:hypothetical protein
MGGVTTLGFRKLPYEDGAQELSKKGAQNYRLGSRFK